MAGIYIHVPFCARRCLYCDFFSNTETKYKTPYLHALTHEIELRKDYLGDEPVETIYFGGGTPSQLEPRDFEPVFDTLSRHFDLSGCREITLEANPDDLRPGYVTALRAFPFNRISMGVQSFKEADLRFLNRRHSREQALRAIRECQEQGFANLSIDLIYGLPGQTPEEWTSNLDTALACDIPHLSAYHLIYEQNTPLDKMREKGQIVPVDEETSLALFSILIDKLAENGFQHYEISNFARPGCYSRHNSSYWNGRKYLGLGPSAHSYNGEERCWNVSSLPAYIEGINEGRPVIETETLSLSARYNDYIITRLRTMWGVDLVEIQNQFGIALRAYCERRSARFIKQGLLIRKNDTLTLSRQGIFVSDGLMSDLLEA